MRLITFRKVNSKYSQLGAYLGDWVLDLTQATGGKIPAQMLGFLENWGSNLRLAQEAAKNPRKEHLIAIKEVELQAPLPNPGSLKDFFAYEDHAKAGSKRRGVDLASEWYEIPAYYKGNHRAILGPDAVIPWPYYTEKLDFECEIACVIGKEGRNLNPQEAQNHIAGYMIYNDVSARDIQKREMRLLFGPNKGKDFANVFGPWLVTSDEVNPVKDFAMEVKVNGESWSKGHYNAQQWGFPSMISYVSQEETIYPGDIFGTGTYFTGCGLDLDRWIKPGDTVELEVGKLGTLRNKVGSPTRKGGLDYKNLNLKSLAKI